MRRLTALAVAVAFSVLGFAPAASAASLCYDVYADINGTVIDESACLPA